MKTVLFLDDDMSRHRLFKQYIMSQPGSVEVTYVWTADGAKKALVEKKFDFASLDHDLGGVADQMCDPDGPTQCPNGTTLARWMRDEMPQSQWPIEIVVHSFNRDGAMAMLRAFREAGHPRTSNSWRPFDLK